MDPLARPVRIPVRVPVQDSGGPGAVERDVTFMRAFSRVALAAALLAFPAASAFAGDPAPASADEEGLPLPPSMDLLRSLRYETGQIQQMAAGIRKETDQAAANLTQQTINDAKNGNFPGASSGTGSGGNGMTGSVNHITEQQKALDSKADPRADGVAAQGAGTGAATSPANAAAGNGDWKGLFDSLPDAIKSKLQDFLNSEIGKLLQGGLSKVEEYVKGIIDKLTAKFPGQQKTIEDAVNKAITAGFGDVKAGLTGGTTGGTAGQTPPPPPAQK